VSSSVGLAVAAQFLRGGAPDTAVVVAAARRRGLQPELVRWDDPAVAWARFDAVLPHAPWDYTNRLPDFLAWLRAAGAATSLLNPPELIAWNTDKRCLLELRDRGVAIPPTLAVDSPASLTEQVIVTELGAHPMVVKATVGSGGREVRRCATAAEAVRAAAAFGNTPLLVTRFVESVTSAGELSAVFFDGRLSHLVRKVPAGGEFRVHERYGGSFHRVTEIEDWITPYCEKVLGALPATARYARVDLVTAVEGEPLLMECELVEPDLYLRLAPDRVDAYLDLVEAA
jgi:glutathione synthase/RimK-type ligase-like ATP-grasp enzyme